MHQYLFGIHRRRAVRNETMLNGCGRAVVIDSSLDGQQSAGKTVASKRSAASTKPDTPAKKPGAYLVLLYL